MTAPGFINDLRWSRLTAFELKTARKAMEQIVDADRVKRRRLNRDRFEHIADIGLRLVARYSMRGIVERVLIQVHQGDTRRRRWKPAAVEEIAGTDPDIQMIRCDVTVVVLDKARRGASPNQTIGKTEHGKIVDAERALRVDGMSGRDLLGTDAHGSHPFCDGELMSGLYISKSASNFERKDLDVSLVLRDAAFGGSTGRGTGARNQNHKALMLSRPRSGRLEARGRRHEGFYFPARRAWKTPFITWRQKRASEL